MLSGGLGGCWPVGRSWRTLDIVLAALEAVLESLGEVLACRGGRGYSGKFHRRLENAFGMNRSVFVFTGFKTFLLMNTD